MHVPESSGDFVGCLWKQDDGNQPTRSSLAYQQFHVSPVRHILFSKWMQRWSETKRPHILFMCQKCGERREQGISLYPLVDIIQSLQINSPREREMRKEQAQEEVKGGAEMVLLICQRNTVLCVLLKRPRKPELSGVGRHTLTSGHIDMNCRFSARFSCT